MVARFCHCDNNNWNSEGLIMENTFTTDNKKILLFGQSSLQNNLFSGYIEQTTGVSCEFFALDGVDSFYNSKHSQTDQLLVLLDAEGLSLDRIKFLYVSIQDSNESIHVAFFNLSDETLSQHLIMWPQVNGLFFDDVSQSQLCQGIQTIFSGGYSLPPHLIYQCFLSNRKKPVASHFAELLTQREKQIIQLVATGASNTEVARELNVSMHTVKTHIYNLFRKIKVSNRVQAINWAKENFANLLQEIE